MTSQVGGERDDRADGQRARDGHDATEAVDDRDGDGRDDRETDAEDRPVHGLADPDVADAARLGGEPRRLAVRVAEHLDEVGARHVEALVHRLRRLGVELVALPRDRGEALADPAGGQDERGQEGEREERELPRHREHRGEHEHDGEQVGEHVRQGRRERLLGAEDVAVEALDERTGARPAEEGERHALDVVEDRGAQVDDEPFADAGGEPALRDAEGAGEHGEAGGDRRERDDEADVAGGDAVVDDALEEERGDGTGGGVDGDEHEERGELAAVGPGEREHPADRAAVQPSGGDGGVLAEGAHAAPAAGAGEG